MKKIKLLLFAAAFAFAFSACDNGGGTGGGETSPSAVITFEAAQLLSETGELEYENILWGLELAGEHPVMGKLYDGLLYKESGLNFGSYYTDMGGAWETWGGFAVSANNNKEKTGDYSNQFSAYASRVTKFAVGYDLGGWMGGEYERPVIIFDQASTILSAKIANTTDVYWYCTDFPNGSKGAEPLCFKLVLNGYKTLDDPGEEPAKVEIMLADRGDILTDWKEFDLKGLGEVKKVVFTFESNDNNSAGNLVPAYFCIDDIKIK